MQEKENKLLKNSIIYAIGNFGSKILTYVMVLIYSFYIDAEDLGYYDLIITTVSMVQPIVVLGINESLYRFLIDKEHRDRRNIIGTSYNFAFISIVIFSLLYVPVVYYFGNRYKVLILLYGVSVASYTMGVETVRGFEKTKLYASTGIINSLITLFLEFFGLVILRGNIEVLLISKTVANVVCSLMSYISTGVIHSLNINNVSRKTLKELLMYSIPLVPNIICWWIMNSSDRYIIRYYLGMSSNGIYAISNKFPTILTTLTSIFFLAWQESAIQDYSSENKDDFYSKIYNRYFTMLFSVCVFLVPITKMATLLFVGQSYKDSWKYASLLFIGAAFSAISGFQGVGYQISKETGKTLYTTIIAALVNIIVNIMLIRSIGLYAACVSTVVAFFILFVIRIFHTRKYYTVNYDTREHILNVSACVITIVLTFIVDNMYWLLFLCLITMIYMFYKNKRVIRIVMGRKN